MDETIYLEQDEEITSVIDKIKNLDAKSIVLLVPKNAAIIQSIVNLKILKKEAQNLQKEIALVTQDKIGRNLASQAGLTVYDSTQSARPVVASAPPEPETSETIELDLSPKNDLIFGPKVKVHHYDIQEKTPTSKISISAIKANFGRDLKKLPDQEESLAYQEKSPWQKTPISQLVKKESKTSRSKIIFFSLLLLALVGLLYYFPQAVISINLQSQMMEKEINILADNNINKINQFNNSIPGELLEVENESSQSLNATGIQEIGDKSEGIVILINGTGDNQTVEQGAELKAASGQVFLAKEAVTVPKATASVDSSGNVTKTSGRVSLKVQANQAGESYNITAASFTVSSNSKLMAESTETMQGGLSKKITIVSQNDLDNAKASMLEEQSAKNLEQIINKAGEQKIISDSLENELLSYSADKKQGEESSTFQATIKVKSRLISYWEKDFREIIVKALSQEIAVNQELLLTSQDEIVIKSTQNDYSMGKINILSSVKTNVVSKIDEAELKNTLSGKKTEFALEQIRRMPGVSSVSLVIKPSWWSKSLPKLSKNIFIKKEVK